MTTSSDGDETGGEAGARVGGNPRQAAISVATTEHFTLQGARSSTIALRGYYFEVAPELAPYLMSVPQPERLDVQGLHGGRWQGYLTVAGMVSVVTSVLGGSPCWRR